MFSKSLFVFAAVAIAINAQSSTPVPTTVPTSLVPSTCVLGCSEPAAVFNKCNGSADLPCVCSNGNFQVDSAACLAKYCPSAVEDAQALQRLVCGTTYSVTFSASATPRTDFYSLVPTQTTTGTPSGSSSPKSSSTSTSTHTSTGTHLEAGVGAFFGAILAGFFTL